MKLTFKPYTLELNHTFTLATSSRTTTPVVLVEIESDGIIGYGEASLPPYLGATQETVMRFLSKLDLSKYSLSDEMQTIIDYIDSVEPGNTAAKASVDIALHDLYGKAVCKPWWNIWGYDRDSSPYTSYTIGIDTEEIIKQKTLEAKDFRLLKVKLGSDNDKMIIDTIRRVTDTPICIDANQGWTDKYFALDMLNWLYERGVTFAEQPMPKEMIDDTAWLTERSPMPVIADESFQRLSDMDKVKGIFSGVNIKLMKCTGMAEAKKIIEVARKENLKVMLGCMTETSCAIAAASQLAPAVDYADLDGNLLIKNDCFEGVSLIDGKVYASDMPGLGIKKRI